ncbi:MAG: hypothetical protein BGO38_06455 [Cellulomonas sp. 73-145]|nr:MAG: hypothetical protein BGO38_06455 [Cellulomonas sp. 73-145]
MVNTQLTSLPGPLLVVVIVLGVIQLTLDVIALVDLVRRPVDRVALGNKWVWVAIILLVNLLGAILYLLVGRRPAPVAEVQAPAGFTPRAGSVAESLYGPRPPALGGQVGPGLPGPDVQPRPGDHGTDSRRDDVDPR